MDKKTLRIILVCMAIALALFLFAAFVLSDDASAFSRAALPWIACGIIVAVGVTTAVDTNKKQK